MATKIVTKNSSTASAVPTASDLVQGELAVNVADKRLFTEDNAGAIVELGTNPYNFTANHNGSAKLATTSTGIDVTGSVTADDLIKVATNGTSAAEVDIVSGATWRLRSNPAFGTNSYGLDIIKGSAGTDVKMSIDSSGNTNFNGNVGIGTTAIGANDRLIIKTTVDNAVDQGLVIQRSANSDEGYINYNGGAFRIIATDGDPIRLGHVSSSDRVSIDPSGNLLVGGTVAGNAGTVSLNVGNVGLTNGGLQLWGTTTGTHYIQFGDESGTAANHYRGYMAYAHNVDSLSFGTASTERMRIDSAGNLLVGKTTTAFNTKGMQIDGSNGNFSITATGATTAFFNRTSTDGSIVGFYKDGTTVGSIGTQGGDLNIGTGACGISFVDGVPALYPWTTTGNATRDAAIDLGDSGARFKDLYLSGTATMDSLDLGGAGGEKLYVYDGGSVKAGFGVDLSGSSRELSMFHSTSGTNGNISFGKRLESNGAYTEAVRIDGAGNLLVGTTASVGTSPAKLEILGGTGGGRCINTKVTVDTSANHITFHNGNGQVGFINTNGTTTAYNTSSDQRLKENIADADDAGSKIDAIQVRQYDWKVDGSHQDYGMIAQELQAVAPEAVSVPEDSEDMMGVDYSKLVPMLIKEIQSLRNRVAQLEE